MQCNQVQILLPASQSVNRFPSQGGGKEKQEENKKRRTNGRENGGGGEAVQWLLNVWL